MVYSSLVKKKTKLSKTTPLYSVGEDLSIKRGVNGLGLFAQTSIKKGDCIIEYVGEIITDKEANSRGGKYLFQTSRNRHIDGTTRKNSARYINHSCRPNCEVDIVRGRVFVYAKKGILPGEELNYDYGEEYFDEHIRPKGCACEKCRERLHSKKTK